MWNMLFRKYTLPAVAVFVGSRSIVATSIESISSDIRNHNHILDYQSKEQDEIMARYKRYLSKHCKPHYLKGLTSINNYDAITKLYEVISIYRNPLTPLQRIRLRAKLHDILYGYRWEYEEREYIKSLFREYYL